jgi:hypothetical protein
VHHGVVPVHDRERLAGFGEVGLLVGGLPRQWPFEHTPPDVGGGDLVARLDQA